MKASKILVIAALPLMAIAIAPAAQAQVSATMPVSAVVANSCIVAAAPLVFAYNPAATADTQSTTTITVTTCFDPYELAIDDCTFGTATSDRKMDLLGTKLDYVLNCATDADPQCLNNWGENNAVDTLTGAPGALATYTVDGLIVAEQGVPSGTYVDTCTVSFQF